MPHPPHVLPRGSHPPHALPQAERDAIAIEQEDKVREFLALRCAPCVCLAVFRGLLRLWGSLTEKKAVLGSSTRCAFFSRSGAIVSLLRLWGRKAALSQPEGVLSRSWRSGAAHGLRSVRSGCMGIPQRGLVCCNCGEAGIDRRTKCRSSWASGACCVVGQVW